MSPTPEALWRILHEECGASPADPPGDFLHHWPTIEYRFMGSLGFGGKVYCANGRRVWVSCYRESETSERRAAIDRTNARIAALLGPECRWPATHPTEEPQP